MDLLTTEGDDDYVYKNRASRTFPIAIPDSLEKKIKNKRRKIEMCYPPQKLQFSSAFGKCVFGLSHLALLY